MSLCSAVRADGGRCRGVAIAPSDLCYSHDPAHGHDRRRAARKGGKAGGRGRPQRELVDIKHRLSDLADGVLTGAVDRADAAVASQVLNVFLRAVSVELKAREQLELIERMEAIEKSLEDRPANGRGGTYVGF